MFRCHVEAIQLFTALIDGRNMHTSEFLLLLWSRSLVPLRRFTARNKRRVPPVWVMATVMRGESNHDACPFICTLTLSASPDPLMPSARSRSSKLRDARNNNKPVRTHILLRELTGSGAASASDV